LANELDINFTKRFQRAALKSNNTKMSVNTVKQVHSLVLDAGPILKNEPAVSTLLGQAEALYTVPSVIEEIRDVVARSRVETSLLPFLKLRSPRPASIKIISDFARKTGDFEVLSKADVQILALAYELECERNHGDWRLRSIPGQKKVNGAPPVSLLEKMLDCPGVTVRKMAKVEESPAPETRGAWGTTLPPSTDYLPSVKPQEQMTSRGEEVNRTGSSEQTDTEPVTEANDQVEAIEISAGSASEESDDEGWITPSNIKKHREKDLRGVVEQQAGPKTMQVATVTTDFAMQNVLLRMNLNLLSTSLQRIQQLKTWVLRCHACFNITKDMSKQFCSRCGKPTLLRTSCSTDKDGNFKVHLKKNMQWNTRGDVYSIPKPVPGSANGKTVAGGGKGGWGQELILAEDQKEYVQAMTNMRRRKDKDLMDEDYMPSILSGDRGRAGGRPKVGAGKNVNSKKRNK
jgi:RNA-binding protein NOB1